MRSGGEAEPPLALTDADEEEQLRGARAELQRLGPGRVATIVRRRLRGKGVRRLPRGSRLVNGQNPTRLTAGEPEVLGLVGQDR